jgi:hypothetical protein
MGTALASLSVAVVTSCSSASRPPELGGPDAAFPVGDDVTEPPHEAGAMPAEASASCSTMHADAGAALMMCAGQCVNTQTDSNNCGGCGQSCGVTGTSCSQGTCQCTAPQVVCNNRCVDVTKDQSNCGFCGHNCQGNPCTAGLCQASNIAQGTSIVDIAVDQTNVYWTQRKTSPGVLSKPSAGGSASPIAGAKDPSGIVVDANHLYWVDYADGSIWSYPLMGGSPVPLLGPVDGGASPGPTALARDAHNLYWVDSSAGTVNQMPLGGGPVIVLATGRSVPVAIAVKGNSVYWVDHGSGSDGSVNKVPVASLDDGGADASGPITPLATNQPLPQGIAVDDANVYWTNRGNPNGTVKSVPVGGGTIQPIADGQGAPTGIAIDSQFVYWTNYDDNTVLKAPLAGGMSYMLASGQNNPSAIAVDEKNVYWANQGSGYILKVSK